LVDLSLSPDDEEKNETEPIPEDEVLAEPGTVEELELWTPDGPLRATDVDLFADTPTLWLQTEDRGWWFIPGLDSIYFLYPQATGHFAIGRATTGNVRKIEKLDQDLSLEYAMAWAEKYAADEDAGTGETWSATSRNAGWRKGNRPASEAQKSQARFQGIPEHVIEHANKRQLSDLISIRIATRALAKVS
jgi:hypothetical protein